MSFLLHWLLSYALCDDSRPTKGHKLVVGADTGDIRACFSHSGSIIRQLDPHDGPVNWLSFASRKTDK